jgi:predicted nucleotide-binding protein
MPDRDIWRRCVECDGATARPDIDMCLRHLERSERVNVLSESAGVVDARGVLIDVELWADISQSVKMADITGHRLRFDEATFDDPIDLKTLDTLGQASFIGTTFEGRVDASGLVFAKPSVFRRARFRCGADFQNAAFRGPTSFRGADLLLGTTFAGARFADTVSFERAIFSGYTDFRSAVFFEAYFSAAQFQGRADFRGVKFTRNGRWRDARFLASAPLADNPELFGEAVMPAPEPKASAAGPPRKPRLFIGSSSESREVARAAEERLADDAVPRIWEHIFQVGEVGIRSLLDTLQTCDFALFVVAADDVAQIRGVEVSTPRDNVIFEIGLAYGQLGSGRVFLLRPKAIPVHLPTDLLGVTIVFYEHDEFDSDPIGSLAQAIGPIRRAIQRIGPRARDM